MMLLCGVVYVGIVLPFIAVVKGEEENEGNFDLTAYQPYHKIVKWLEKLTENGDENSVIKTLWKIGETFEKRDILALKIHKLDGSSKGENKKKTIVIDCGAHAREWISPATCLYLIKQLISGGQQIISQYDWVFIPVLNPDGYVYTWKNKETRMWRKNRSYTTKQFMKYNKTGKDICLGVDINRNFDSHWGEVNGIIKNPCYEMYAGSNAFSEKESQALADYLEKSKEDIIAYISLHTYGQSWMTPFGHTGKQPKGYSEMERVAKLSVKAMKKNSGVKYRIGSSHDILYPHSGNSVDWAYDKLGIPYTYLIEMRPGSRKKLKPAFTAPASEMVKNCNDLFVGISTMARHLNINFRHHKLLSTKRRSKRNSRLLIVYK